MKTFSLRSIFLVFSFLSCIPTLPAGALSAEKQVVGWIENVYVFPGNFKIKAKMDTGAKSSSLHADQIYEFKRDGKKWVRFELTNREAYTKTFEAMLIRTSKIKKHHTKSEKRQVVRLGVCLGTVYKEVEVNLVDRSNFNYKMLVGRNFLKGSFVVDSDQKFTVKQECRGARNR